ncbi:hypothetical protein [Micromonospora sp. NPDC005220]
MVLARDTEDRDGGAPHVDPRAWKAPAAYAERHRTAQRHRIAQRH